MIFRYLKELRKGRSDRWSDVDEIMIRSGWQPVSRRYIAAGGGRGRVHAGYNPVCYSANLPPLRVTHPQSAASTADGNTNIVGRQETNSDFAS